MASNLCHTTTVDVNLRQSADPNTANNVRELQSIVLAHGTYCVYTLNVLTVIPQITVVMTTYHDRMCTLRCTRSTIVCSQ